MSDLLIALYNLPERKLDLEEGISIRRAIAPEMHLVCDWVEKQFGKAWKSEVSVAFSGHPISVWIAVKDNQVIGFACHDATAKGFFGPTGVSPDFRGKAIGQALLLETLYGMKEAGYGYGIIGGAGGKEKYYGKSLDIYPIPNSTPGFYKGMLR